MLISNHFLQLLCHDDKWSAHWTTGWCHRQNGPTSLDKWQCNNYSESLNKVNLLHKRKPKKPHNLVYVDYQLHFDWNEIKVISHLLICIICQLSHYWHPYLYTIFHLPYWISYSISNERMKGGKHGSAPGTIICLCSE